ncbi:MAG TPA: signal recognition particle receptor subunit alpha, partial [Desulfatiglandales bacterium]|nr:signal recognition particle receptor subunit alpha [Desulfatiglandales bacterium]
MFDNLSQKLNKTFKKLKGHGKLNESNIEDALKEVRLALLEADTNYKVVKKLIEDIRGRAIGREVLESLTPGQQVVKIVNEELIRLMGTTGQPLHLTGRTPFVIILVGLQGSGKTTTAGKLALHLRKQGRNPYLVPADIYRPAAMEQLKRLGAQISIPVHESQINMTPEDICLEALSSAGSRGSDVLIMD